MLREDIVQLSNVRWICLYPYRLFLFVSSAMIVVIFRFCRCDWRLVRCWCCWWWWEQWSCFTTFITVDIAIFNYFIFMVVCHLNGTIIRFSTHLLRAERKVQVFVQRGSGEIKEVYTGSGRLSGGISYWQPLQRGTCPDILTAEKQWQ